MATRTYKLWVHEKQWDGDVVLNPDVFSDVRANDILALENPLGAKDGWEKFYLQVTEKSLSDGQGLKVIGGIISVSKDVAEVFRLQPRQDVRVHQVREEDVSVEMVELVFKEQYISRSDMWYLTMSLSNTCVYQRKNIHHQGIRAVVDEIWNAGKKLMSGRISKDTKIVFRSYSAMFLILIQVSPEMWDTSDTGLLLYERTVDGMLGDMFERWRHLGCSHEVTIVLFSRTFFVPVDRTKRLTMEDFPKEHQPSMLQGTDGRWYQDSYKVLAFSETRPDWTPLLVDIKREMLQYKDAMDDPHKGCAQEGNKYLSQASSAREGNFLEAINFSLCTFDKHYVDRNFERTGQLVVVISAGTGVFDVSATLPHTTKQRMMDNGIGCDLVCVSQPPLHLVPIFIKQNTQVFQVPHWISQSFYTADDFGRSHHRFALPHFVPRCSMKDVQAWAATNLPHKRMVPHLPHERKGPMALPEDSDAQLTIGSHDSEGIILMRTNKARWVQTDYQHHDSSVFAVHRPHHVSTSDASSHHGSNHYFSAGSTNDLSNAFRLGSSYGSLLSERMGSLPRGHSRQRLASSPKPGHSRVTKTSSMALSSRRGVHLAPLAARSMSGTLAPALSPPIVLSPTHSDDDRENGEAENEDAIGTPIPHATSDLDKPAYRRVRPSDLDTITPADSSVPRRIGKLSTSGPAVVNPFNPGTFPDRLSFGRRRWSHIFHHNVHASHEPHGPNWKSLCKPACLPLTTDYFPGTEELNSKYEQKPYTITTIDDDDDDTMDLKLENTLKELVSQRLALGFQLVVQNNTGGDITMYSGGILGKAAPRQGTRYVLGLCSAFHTLSVDPGERNIEIKRYTRIAPDSANPQAISYAYRLWPTHASAFQNMTITFKAEPVENLNWNYIDQVVLGYNHKEPISLSAVLKFWRTRFVLLPADPPSKDETEAESVSREQARVGNFDKFKTLIQKLGKFDMPDIPVLPFTATATTLTHAHESRRMQTGREGHEGPPTQLTSQSPLTDIVSAAQHTNSGLAIGARRWHLRKHLHCFVGQQFVSWLMQKVGKVKNRDDACALAQRMLTESYIECPTSKNPKFVDGYAFYRFKQGPSSPTSPSMTDTPKALSTPTGSRSSIIGGTATAAALALGLGSKVGPNKVLRLSECVVYDPGSDKKDRAKWIVIHFDSHYNPLRPYHIEFHWMVSTGCMMDELLQLLHRKARSCKFLFVPLPIVPLGLGRANDNPLQAPLFIPLAATFPWAPDLKDGDGDSEPFLDYTVGATCYQYLCQIVLSHGFMVDIEADARVAASLGGRKPSYTYLRPEYKYSQWVHRTGAALVQVVDDAKEPGLLWAENTLLTTKWRAFGATSNESTAVQLLKQLRAFCSNQDQLAELWQTISTKEREPTPPTVRSHRTRSNTLSVESEYSDVMSYAIQSAVAATDGAASQTQPPNISDSWVDLGAQDYHPA